MNIMEIVISIVIVSIFLLFTQSEAQDIIDSIDGRDH